MNRLIGILMILLSLPLSAAETQDSITVSLITCWPGTEVYELCGHEAVRVRGMLNGRDIDMVWNYGTFDFDQPNFIFRFVKGETDYKLSSYPFKYFMPEYEAAGRRVVEQDLNLTQQEAKDLLSHLTYEALPQNATYRYNYVKDNCATRVINVIDRSVGQPVIYPDSIHYGTFRNEMRAYHRDYPWYQFGIDLALGSGLDYPLKGKEEMFVPLEMMRKAENAHLPDGRKLVAETRVLNAGVEDATLGPTSFWVSPLAVALYLLAITLVLCWLQWHKRTIWKLLYSIWFGVSGLAGCLIAFLVFVSSHEATSPNLLLLWLNPLQLVIALGVWWRKWRSAVTAMIYVNIILIGVLMIVWPFQPQSANPAFFPLMGVTLALSICYAIIYSNISYKINEEVGNIGVGKLRTGRSRGTGVGAKRRRPAASRRRNRR